MRAVSLCLLVSVSAYAEPADWSAYEKGVEAQQKNDLAKAEGLLDRGCKSGLSTSCHALAGVLIQKREFAKARAALEVETAMRGPAPGIAYSMAASYAREGKTNDAIQWLNKAYTLGVNDFDGANEDADLQSLKSDSRFAALQQTYACPAAKEAYTHVKVAMDQFRGGRPLEGARLWELAVKKLRTCAMKNDEDIATLLGNIGTVHRDHKQLAKANQFYGEALELEKKLKREDQVSLYLNNIAYDDYFLGDKAKATAGFEALLQVDRKLGKENEVGASLNNLGALYKEAKQYDRAIKAFEESIAIAERRKDKQSELGTKGSLADTYKNLGQYDKAIELFTAALPEVRTTSPKPDLILHLGGLGQTYFHKGDFAKALEIQSEALALERQHGKPAQVAQRLLDLSFVYEGQGDGDRAMKALEEALAINKKLDLAAAQAEVHAHIASYHFKFYRLDKAESHARESLALARKSNGNEATALGILGRTQRRLGRHQEALATLEAELAIHKKSGSEPDQSDVLANIGSIHVDMKAYDKARASYDAAMALDKKRNDEKRIAKRLNDLGVLAFEQGQFPTAVARFVEVLPIFRKLKDQKHAASVLSNLGVTYFQTNQWAKAIPLLKENVTIVEELRRTAPLESKREYLQSQLANYQALSVAYFLTKDSVNGLAVLEQSRAKVLREQMGSNETAPTLTEIQKSLPAPTAVIYYQNTQNVQLMLAVTRAASKLVPRYYAPLLASAKPAMADAARAPSVASRGLTRIEEPQELVKSASENEDYDQLISTFRTLLADPSPESAPKAKALARLLYDHLIAPIEPQLKGKTELIIVPDQGLAVLPFEALVDANGKYLIERFTIQYTQSLGVKQLVEKRAWPAGRKPLLALGGARYQGARVPAEYVAQGVTAWQDLPGTLSEVQELGKIVSGSELIIGDEVSRTRLRTTDLSQYKMLHFATHGLVVPQKPEMSALVLSQRSGDDGYLRMDEIEKLKLKADLVTLSACETGLGKVYAGEGVVGLAQAFLIAGANGVTVSLWKVSDDSTAKLMVELYKAAQASYHPTAALAEIKRRFIKGEMGDSYRAAYYWAPFVYYGR